jgi:hypothetical protein
MWTQHMIMKASGSSAVSSLEALSSKTTAFWDLAPCSLVELDRRFRGVHYFRHQGDVTLSMDAVRISET